MRTIKETVDLVVAGGGTAGHIAAIQAVKAGIILYYHEFTGEVKNVGNIWKITSYGRGIKRITTARELILKSFVN